MLGTGLTIGEIASYIGRSGSLPIEGGELVIEVEVKDAKAAFGRVDLLVTPVFGAGEKWVQGDRIEFNEEA